MLISFLSTYLACVCDIELLEKRFDVISKCLRYLALPLGVVVDVTFRGNQLPLN